jgi:hypothetical protein
MRLDLKLIEEAKLEIAKLKDLSALSYPEEVRAEEGEFCMTFGFNISKEQDAWITQKAKQYTRGKKSAFFRTLLDTLMQLDKPNKLRGGRK